jgi:hypothetical protein
VLALAASALGRLADWIEDRIPVDLFDVEWPGDEPDGWIFVHHVHLEDE